jgi:hypothetical protein
LKLESWSWPAGLIDSLFGDCAPHLVLHAWRSIATPACRCCCCCCYCQRHAELQSGPVRSTDVNRVTVPLGLFRSIIHPSPTTTDAMRLWVYSGRQPDGSNEYNGQNHLRFRFLHPVGSSVPPVESWRGQRTAWRDVRATWCVARQNGTGSIERRWNVLR